MIDPTLTPGLRTAIAVLNSMIAGQKMLGTDPGRFAAEILGAARDGIDNLIREQAETRQEARDRAGSQYGDGEP